MLRRMGSYLSMVGAHFFLLYIIFDMSATIIAKLKVLPQPRYFVIADNKIMHFYYYINIEGKRTKSAIIIDPGWATSLKMSQYCLCTMHHHINQ